MSYRVPLKAHQVVEVIKGSRFTTQIVPVTSVAQVKQALAAIRRAQPDATHHCSAYIIGPPDNTTLLGCSDDGEPAGTAGKPMLTVLQHSGVSDLLAICTRYYGGTKLGTGGLARAYGGGVKLVMSELATQEKVDWQWFSIELDYAEQAQFEHELGQLDGEITSVEYGAIITLHGKLPLEHKAIFQQRIQHHIKETPQWNTSQ